MNQASSLERVRFDRPPVTEVVCGITFSLPVALQTAHVGSFWSTVKDQFPSHQDVAPLPSIVEGPETTVGGLDIELTDLPPLRRTWFVSTDGSELLQIQHDRFLLNWRRRSAHYPSYDNIVVKFFEYWDRFCAFAASAGLTPPTVRQLELTYVNSMGLEAPLTDVGSVLTEYRVGKGEGRFLPEPSLFQWQTAYDLPDANGRLHVTVQKARLAQNNQPALRLDMTARGIPPGSPVGDLEIRQWFDLGHEWITHGFADITSAAAHQYWGRRS